MKEVTIRYEGTVTTEIDLTRVLNYLIMKGWLAKEKYGEFGVLFNHPKYDELFLYPTRDTLVDFDLRISELIATLSRCEGREVPEIINDIEKSALSKLVDLVGDLTIVPFAFMVCFYILKALFYGT